MQNIIEDYFKITGRPIATMTVTEYLEFMRFNGNNDDENKRVVNTPDFSVQQESDKEKAVAKPEKTPLETRINKVKEGKSSNALAMLRSVNG